MRIALGVEYDGADFCGWQSQTGCRTVQDEVEKAISFVADTPLAVVCAGRTDTGVHALGQVVHVETDVIRSDRSWVLGCNSNLPGDVNINWSREVDEDFHARFSATARSYRYIILNRLSRSAIHQHRVCWRHQAIDEVRMAEACRYFPGEHDFTSFRALACQAKHAVREIHRIEVKRQGEYIIIDVTANAFLHHMVRNIVGTLLAIGQGEQEPQWVQALLEARDRSIAGITAPAQGLYLVSVAYPDKFALPAIPRPPVLA
ncbi:MAG TPA: tRNA pseudouridine(38-40) synthase TruA [Gammaproteobacteria bacterium]|nr:tRNA pseudouridine(38-40) synthase TruA [Gammaproteobacteria bacterium]